MNLTAKITKAARALLGWSSATLSRESEVSHDTIRAFESGRTKSLITMNQRAIVDTIEAAGVEFIPENGAGAGVRFKHKSTPKNDVS